MFFLIKILLRKQKLFIQVLGISMLFLIFTSIYPRQHLYSLSCHYLTDGDALPAAEKLDVTSDSIFFLETSCRGGLNSRQACAVESVARIYPERNIYVFFSSPVLAKVLTNSCLAELLFNFNNVKVGRIHSAEYAKGTALQEILAEIRYKKSPYKIEDTADMLRLVTLYKYGGMYLDTDVLLVKRLDALGKNWAARESSVAVANGIIASGKDGPGHDIIGAVLDEINSHYRSEDWAYNGPGALTRVLLKYCNTTNIQDLSANVCNGFQIYNPELIYPIPWQGNRKYFKRGDLSKNETEKVYTHHVWNFLSHGLKVAKDSPYDKLTKKLCPAIRKMFEIGTF